MRLTADVLNRYLSLPLCLDLFLFYLFLIFFLSYIIRSFDLILFRCGLFVQVCVWREVQCLFADNEIGNFDIQIVICTSEVLQLAFWIWFCDNSYCVRLSPALYSNFFSCLCMLYLLSAFARYCFSWTLWYCLYIFGWRYGNVGWWWWWWYA